MVRLGVRKVLGNSNYLYKVASALDATNKLLKTNNQKWYFISSKLNITTAQAIILYLVTHSIKKSVAVKSGKYYTY